MSSRRLCPDCGLKLALVGTRHNCRPRLVKISGPVPAVANARPQSVTNKGADGNVERVVRWRTANPNRYRAYQRSLMRKRQAK